MKFTRKIAALVGGTAAVALLAGTGGAVAGSLITSKDIKDNTVRSKDIKDGTVRLRDLTPAARQALAGQDGANGVNGAQGPAGAAGQDGAPGSVAGVQTNWEAKNGATIVDATTVRLSNVGTPAGASVQIENLNLAVQAGQTLSFTYRLADGAVYGGGVPRVFIETQGSYFNTFNGDPADAGVDNGDGTFTKTVTIPSNGRVGEAGIVVDFGVGSVTVSNVTIAGKVLKFS